jgi:hypothetical protein
MNKKKQEKLEKKGWKIGSVSDFLDQPKSKKLIKVPVMTLDTVNANKNMYPSNFQRLENHFGKIQELHGVLLDNIKKNLPELEKLLETVNGHWFMEDCVYRFYHASFKTYFIQTLTMDIVDALKKLAPEGVTFNSTFEDIYKEGTGKIFNIRHNNNWEKHTRPMLEAFFHAKYFLEVAVKYGRKLKEAPTCLPSGWAALLYFYNLR